MSVSVCVCEKVKLMGSPLAGETPKKGIKILAYFQNVSKWVKITQNTKFFLQNRVQQGRINNQQNLIFKILKM